MFLLWWYTSLIFGSDYKFQWNGLAWINYFNLTSWLVCFLFEHLHAMSEEPFYRYLESVPTWCEYSHIVRNIGLVVTDVKPGGSNWFRYGKLEYKMKVLKRSGMYVWRCYRIVEDGYVYMKMNNLVVMSGILCYNCCRCLFRKDVAMETYVDSMWICFHIDQVLDLVLAIDFGSLEVVLQKYIQWWWCSTMFAVLCIPLHFGF